MKYLILKVGIACLNVLYTLFKLLPVQKKIAYLSRQQNTIPLDYQMIAEEAKREHPDYRNVFLVKMIPDGLIGKLGYCFYILLQMYHIATAQAAILDTYCIPICTLKQRKSLIVIQIWHALGAFKKFSYSILDQEEGRSSAMARAMHMHENYTYVLTSSSFCAPFFREAFHAKEEQMKVIPLPRVDYITDPEVKKKLQEEIYRKYPSLRNNGKKVLVYAPTFRKYDVDFNEAVDRLVACIDFTKYELIVKLHPLSDVVIRDPRVIQDHSFATHEIFQIADGVIADYSAVIYEAALLQIPMYFYVFDYGEYAQNRNFYFDYLDMVPGTVAGTAEEIVRAIEEDNYDYEKLKWFCDLMIERNEETSAHRILELIFPK